MSLRSHDGRVRRGDATRAQIIAAASTAFAAFGYKETSIDALLSRLQMSRGALYHHFPDKRSLFTAVLIAQEERIFREVVAAAADIADPRDALIAGATAFLVATTDPVVRQIVLTDAPAVLGWDAWREIDASYSFGSIRLALERNAALGRIGREELEAFAHILLASLLELALLLSRGEATPARIESAAKAARTLIERLVAKN